MRFDSLLQIVYTPLAQANKQKRTYAIVERERRKKTTLAAAIVAAAAVAAHNMRCLLNPRLALIDVVALTRRASERLIVVAR